MRVQVLYFAGIREAAGSSGETLTLTQTAPTVQDLCAQLRAQGGAWERILSGAAPVKFAVNQQFAELTTPLSEGCEVAIFPPVTGG